MVEGAELWWGPLRRFSIPAFLGVRIKGCADQSFYDVATGWIAFEYPIVQ